MMKLFKHWVFVIIGSLTIVAIASAAQVNFTPTLLISEEYTDNLRQDSDDSIKIDDYITTADLDLEFSVLGRTAGMTINLNPAYNIFADNDFFDYWRYYVSLNLYKAFSRNTRLELNSNYLETEDPRDSSDDDTGGGLSTIEVDPTRRGRNRYSSNFNSLRLSHQFGPNSNVFGEVAYNTLEDIDIPLNPLSPVDDFDEVRPAFGMTYWYEQNWGMIIDFFYSDRDYANFDDGVRAERDDREEYNGSIRLLKRFSRRFSGYVQYRETHLEYDQEIVFSDFKILSPSVGIEYLLSEATRFSIGAGYYDQKFDDPTMEDDSGSFVETEINNNWVYPKGYFTLNLASGYDIEDRGAQDLGLQIYYQSYIELGRNFTSRLAGEVNLTLRYDEYPNQTPERSDDTIAAGVALRYQALQWMNLRLAYEHVNVDSDEPNDDYKENSVIFSITMTPSSPMRLN